jgi:hypothetical protein
LISLTMSGENGKSWKIETMPPLAHDALLHRGAVENGLVAGLQAAVDAGVERVRAAARSDRRASA